MVRKATLPERALIVRTYDEFRRLCGGFVTGQYGMFIVVADGGVGKSEIISRAMQAAHGTDGWGHVVGKHSPLDVYSRLFKYRNLPVVFDDLDGLLDKPDNIAVLKAVCDSKQFKRVEWGSTHSAFCRPDNPLPPSFLTESRVCIIANEWGHWTRNLQALQDRGVVVSFEPSALEVHCEVGRGRWFPDQEVFKFIGKNLFLMTRPSFRIYLQAREHKLAGMDWRDLTLRSLCRDVDPATLLVAQLLATDRYNDLKAPEEARVRAFRKVNGGSRATYFRHKKALEEMRGSFNQEDVDRVDLQSTLPDAHTAALLAECARQEQQPAQSSMLLVNAADTQPYVADMPVSVVPGPIHPLAILRREMDRAASREDYEAAARLRDEIRALSTRQAGECSNN